MEPLIKAIIIALPTMFVSYMVKQHLILDEGRSLVTAIWLVAGLGTVLFTFGLLMLYGPSVNVIITLTLLGGVFGFLVDGLVTTVKERLRQGKFKDVAKQAKENLDER